MHRWISAFVALTGLAASAVARANGAFPDSENILTPEDRPDEILLVTNFGLIATADGGKTWLWSCEQAGNALGAFYQLTSLPRNRLFTVANQNLAFSDDGSCGWQTAGGAVSGQSITDAYLDPVGGTRVLAIGVANQIYSLFPSADTGVTFSPALLVGMPGQSMTGVEIARSDPNVVYLAIHGPDGSPLLARSGDGGTHFTVTDLSADLGPGLVRIIAVDPHDPDRLLLSFLGANDQSIALSVDGGRSATKPLTVNGNFTAYTRLPSGTILVAGTIEYATAPGLFRSHDNGATFEMVASPPSIRALSQRGGVVYAAADNFGDGYAIGRSTDEGTTWQGVMAYADVTAINPCLAAFCQSICDNEVSMSLWTAEVCSAAPPATTGTGGGAGHADAGGAGMTGAAGERGTPDAGSSDGGCDVAGGGPTGPGLLSALFLLLCRRRGSRQVAQDEARAFSRATWPT